MSTSNKQTRNRKIESKRDYLENKTTSLFWEIELHDADINIRSGKIGFDGEITKTTHASIDEAKAQFEILLDQKQTEGFNSVKKLTQAFNIEFSDTNQNQGWALGQPVGIKWREQDGKHLTHLFTLWIPHEYRVKGEQFVAISAFQIHLDSDDDEAPLTWQWLTEDEFFGELTPLPNDIAEVSPPRFFRLTPRKYDPNVGKAPEYGDDYGDWNEEDLEWANNHEEEGNNLDYEARKEFSDDEYAEILKGSYVHVDSELGSKVKLCRFVVGSHIGGTLGFNPNDYRQPTSPFYIEFGGEMCGLWGQGWIHLEHDDSGWVYE